MFLFHVLFVLLSRFTAILAHTECFFPLDNVVFEMLPFPPPIPSDCHELMAHLPSAASPPDSADLDYYLDVSSPFLPQAAFLHDTCTVSVSYHESRMPPDWEAVEDLLENIPGDSPLMPLRESTVLEIWAVAREAIGRIVDQCLDPSRRDDVNLGVDWGPLEVPGIANAWYLVHLGGVVQRGAWDNRVAEQGPAAIHDREMEYSQTYWKV